jgi:hypothetical protein
VLRGRPPKVVEKLKLCQENIYADYPRKKIESPRNSFFSTIRGPIETALKGLSNEID